MSSPDHPGRPSPPGRLPAAFLSPGTSSFTDFLHQLAPGQRPTGGLPVGGETRTAAAAVGDPSRGGVPAAPHATTILALETADGVLMAGDRRATAGNVVVNRDVVKVRPADSYSAIGFAGIAGIGMELLKLYQVELEHFEKIEEMSLSLDGKAARLASMIRGNLGLTMQGLAAVPILAGYDQDSGRGRVFSFDVTGGPYPESEHHVIGSGSWFARGALKKLWRPGLGEADAVVVAVEALYDAAEDDTATGGPDPVRGVWPIVAVVDADGYREIDEATLRTVATDVIRRRSGPAGTGDRGGDDSQGGATP